ncbi:unnamed protein product, partial [Echinostoma caproni]|uniref:Phosphatidylinositol-4,5-bisphosphate 4-phosphatase n=1 Tax=Echinostoma caproni TaxID=27848 RepID=A0A183ADY5_9TREM
SWWVVGFWEYLIYYRSASATINCQVCNHVVPLQNRHKQLVVRCPNCTEATPIKGPPAGKQYVRCPCNCLLICSASTTRVGCPRPECQKVIVLFHAPLTSTDIFSRKPSFHYCASRLCRSYSTVASQIELLTAS